jgi:hypothetical protein
LIVKLKISLFSRTGLESIKTSEENNITMEGTGIIETPEVKCDTSIVLLPFFLLNDLIKKVGHYRQFEVIYEYGNPR